MDMRRMSIVCSERFMIDPVNEKSPGDTCRRALLFSTCFTWLQADRPNHHGISEAVLLRPLGVNPGNLLTSTACWIVPP